MLNKIVETVVKPVINRLGTALATMLIVSLGADSTLAYEVASGLGALALIGVDLLNAYVSREKAKAKAVAKSAPVDMSGR